MMNVKDIKQELGHIQSMLIGEADAQTIKALERRQKFLQQELASYLSVAA